MEQVIEILGVLAAAALPALLAWFGGSPTVEKVKEIFPSVTGGKTIIIVIAANMIIAGLSTLAAQPFVPEDTPKWVTDVVIPVFMFAAAYFVGKDKHEDARREKMDFDV